MKRLLLIAGVAALCHWCSARAEAQVRIGPGFLEAPYVRIDFYRGGLHIQAPFVNLYTRPPAHHGSHARSDHRPQHPLAAAAYDLNRELGRFDTREMWRAFLAVAPGETLSVDRSDVAGIDQVAKILANFEAVSKDEQYRKIAELPAFQQTHTLLAAYLRERQNPPAPPEEVPPPQPIPAPVVPPQ